MASVLDMGVCDEKNDRSTNQPHGLPAFLSFHVAILDAEVERVIENKFGSLEAHSMFGSIGPAFRLVPRETDRRTGHFDKAFKIARFANGLLYLH
jgi:hypothetical protein